MSEYNNFIFSIYKVIRIKFRRNDEFAKTLFTTNRVVQPVLNLRESRRASCAMEHNSEAR